MECVMENKNLKIVYTITERGERHRWNRIGVGYVNRDGSINVKLDAIPVNGTMQLRDWTPRDDMPGQEGKQGGEVGQSRDGRDGRDSRKRSHGPSRGGSQSMDSLPVGY